MRTLNRFRASVHSLDAAPANKAPVSQKPSQQYSRHFRDRFAISDGDSSRLRHSADQPASPRTFAAMSARSNSSHANRDPFPSRTHTK